MEINMLKVCVFLADGFEEIEGLTVVDLLRRAEIEATMVSITGKLEVTSAHQIKVVADVLFDECTYHDVDMLVLPGGMPGTRHLSAHEGLVSLLKEFNDKNKYLAAICAAPSVLGENGILKGRCVTSYPGFEDKLIGATYTGNKVEIASNILTSKGMGTSIDFALCIITLLKGEETANQIGKAIQYI
jgi:4-methyl-5(b-hydroxyethyl)-thiazole monophosphate biosynthesis